MFFIFIFFRTQNFFFQEKPRWRAGKAIACFQHFLGRKMLILGIIIWPQKYFTESLLYFSMISPPSSTCVCLCDCVCVLSLSVCTSICCVWWFFFFTVRLLGSWAVGWRRAHMKRKRKRNPGNVCTRSMHPHYPAHTIHSHTHTIQRTHAHILMA